MGVREVLNQYRMATGAVAFVVVVAAVVVITMQLRQNRAAVYVPRQAFYSEDDGASYFTDAHDRIVPFERTPGKPAHRAHVFECDGKRFVGFLDSLTELARQRLEAAKAAGTPGRADVDESQLLVKRPGGKWVPLSRAEEAAAVQRVTCPDGQPARAIAP